MSIATTSEILVKNTTHKVVLPFYLYAAFAILFSTILLFFSTSAFGQHYFHPKLLAITHSMALGWGTMIILGASHQLIPVLIEGSLYSIRMAYATFCLAATGIPFLIYGFYYFNMGWPAQLGGLLINLSILAYLINISMSMFKNKNENIHAVFIFTAGLWLFLTTFLGLLLLYNFSKDLLPKDSLQYLPMHAHMGIIGWFLLMVMGVGSRLIPMFLISKYGNPRLLWIVYGLINAGLISFIALFLFFPNNIFYLFPLISIFLGLSCFGYYCYQCFKMRIRKHVDAQIQLSLLSVGMMGIPLLLLFVIIASLMIQPVSSQMVLTYGFVIFFGWITAMIFGMTFKTLPFIVWNKVYHLQVGHSKTPNPGDLFSNRIFKCMGLVYLLGFVLFVAGIFIESDLMLKTATVFLLMAALLYNWNVLKLIFHKSTL